MNEALAGKVYPAVRFPVPPDRVAAFARAVGATGASVPPTFATAPEIEAMRALIEDPELALDFSRVVHADQSYAWHRPIAPDEVLTATPSIESIRSKAGSELLVVATEIVDEAGSPVVSARCTLVVRPEGVGA
ncbi:MAG TPA: MaoC family dehydratase N-terminal domain-containing protein [Actinomycetota bacterium]